MIGLILIGIAVVANVYLARKKNRSVFVWMVLALLFFLFSTIVLLLLKERTKGAKIYALLIICFLALPFLWIFAENKYYSQKQAIKVIQALEVYKQDNNVYPAKLEELVPRYLVSLPKPKLGSARTNRFYYNRGYELWQKSERDDPQKYCLTYFIFYVARTTYIPSQHKWVNWD